MGTKIAASSGMKIVHTTKWLSPENQNIGFVILCNLLYDKIQQ